MSADRRYHRALLARLAIDGAIFTAGVAVSLWLLDRLSSLAMAAFWVALFLAVTAFAIILRETPR